MGQEGLGQQAFLNQICVRYTENFVAGGEINNMPGEPNYNIKPLFETHSCRKLDTYDSARGAISDTFKNSAR